MPLKIVMLGDIVGKPGRQAVAALAERIREEHRPDLLIANAENIAGGSGLTPNLYDKLMAYGFDGLTLGDHAFRKREIVPVLASRKNIVRPANLPGSAAGRGSMKLSVDPSLPTLHVITLLGRVFMNGPLADDPFAAADRFLATVPAGDVVLVEMHCEATSEKVAVAHHLDGRVAAVLGTHTHVPTADARILPGGTAFMTDLGMSGPYDSVIGRKKERVLEFMTSGMPAPFDVADGDVRVCGAVLQILDNGRARSIERIEYPFEPE